MDEKDVIIVKGISDEEYDAIISEAVRYAVISLPFTINRMRILQTEKRILNIAKGKIAEKLFRWYCKKHGIAADFKACETPFWQTDRRDFVFGGYEWDIKNNFLYHEGEYYDRYTSLPALIPDRNPNDQWGTRLEKKLPGTHGVRYLFTFMKGAGPVKKRDDYFLHLNLSQRQLETLQRLYMKYHGNPLTRAPFDEGDFWNFFNKDHKQLYRLNDRPRLVITGYAGDALWHRFRDTGPGAPNHFVDFVSPSWYRRVGARRSLSWLNGTLWTRITNKTLPVRYLEPFAELIKNP